MKMEVSIIGLLEDNILAVLLTDFRWSLINLSSDFSIVGILHTVETKETKKKKHFSDHWKTFEIYRKTTGFWHQKVEMGLNFTGEKVESDKERRMMHKHHK